MSELRFDFPPFARLTGGRAIGLAVAVILAGCADGTVPENDAAPHDASPRADTTRVDSAGGAAIDGSARADAATRADASAQFDATARADAASVVTDAGGPCCVTLSGLEGGDIEAYCVNPAGDGVAATATPLIYLEGGASIVLRAGESQTTAATDRVLVSVTGTTAGDYTNPSIQYWNSVGTRYDNNAAAGAAHINALGTVGTQVTGTFNSIVVNTAGSGGAGMLVISGTFCAVRIADR